MVIVTTKGKKALTHGNAKVDSTKEAEVVVAEAVDPAYEKVFDVVEQMPEFVGGQAELMKFLAENVHYPEAAYKVGKQGRVIVTFIVEADGSVSNAKIVKKVSDELDAEALRVIGTMPKWKPGMQNGKAVRVKYTIPSLSASVKAARKRHYLLPSVGSEHPGSKNSPTFNSVVSVQSQISAARSFKRWKRA